MEQSMNQTKIKGWGSDADFNRRPYHPIHSPQGDTGAHWGGKAEQQKSKVEILKSNERPDLTAVFGTTVPPSGISGMIRRFAFRYSENSLGHWMPLILADRINFIEGMVEDIIEGKAPRLLGDGYLMDYKYNRKAFYFRLFKNVFFVAAPIAALYYLFRKD